MATIRPFSAFPRHAGAAQAGKALRQPPCRRQLACARAAVGGGPLPSTDHPAQTSKLTEAIMEAESRLAALFEPGKPMPRAGVVTAMRQEVSELKAQLAQAMVATGGPDAVQRDATLATDDELAERARQAFLEVERMLGQKAGGGRSRRDSAALALLEAENERLRIEATALLLRQQQLEELVEKLPKAGRAQA